MDYCAPRGIPYERFLRWGPLSQDAAIAWQRRENDRCQGCHQLRSDLVDEHGVERRNIPVRAVDWYCPGCAALAKHDRGHTGDRRPGVATALIPTAVADAWTASHADDGV